jgi:geranylgeranyl reductase family protein
VKYDVVVVGAGPAGSAAAISLAELGWSVLLVDRARFPRDKVCGDFLSPRSIRVLQALGCWEAIRSAQRFSIHRSLVHLDGKLISRGPMPDVNDLAPYGLVVPRLVLDEILIRRAAHAGAEVVEGMEATGLSLDPSGITVQARSGRRSTELIGRLVIIAEGARSRLTSGLELVPAAVPNDMFALRAYYTDVASDPGTSAIFFDASYFPGYAWFFPTGDGRANVGMGIVTEVSRRYGINLRERFVRWLERDTGFQDLVGGARIDGRIKGWPLRVFHDSHRNYADRVLVVGDAGRFIDPINGEGIHTALESARIASSVAGEALASGDLSAASLSVYDRRWRTAFDLDLRTSDLIVTVAKNRDLLPLWLLVVRMVAERSMVDGDFASAFGGIMAGVVPSHRGMSPELAARMMTQSPAFWLRNQREVRRALAALWMPSNDNGPATTGARDRVRWASDVWAKSVALSEGLTNAYGVPWPTPPRRGAERPYTADLLARTLDAQLSVHSAVAKHTLAVLDAVLGGGRRSPRRR